MLKEKFAQFGAVYDAFVVKNKFTGDTKGIFYTRNICYFIIIIFYFISFPFHIFLFTKLNLLKDMDLLSSSLWMMFILAWMLKSYPVLRIMFLTKCM